MRVEALQRWSPQVLSILRIVSALLLLQFGMAKLLGYPHVQMFQSIQLASLYGIAGLIELIGGSLLLIGLFTRPVAFIVSGEMAAAYFIGAFPEGLHSGAQRRQ